VLLGDAHVEAPVRVRVGERAERSIAAVIATTSPRWEPIAASSVAKTLVQVVDFAFISLPVSGSIGSVWCIWSTSSFSASGKPQPLRVTACTTTGPPNALARRSAVSSATMSCPSTGPRYFRPRSSNIICGLSASLIAFFIACSVV
jgi:hypothetical protein